METLRFSLDAYEGPLDLLLNLITKNKVNICDIPIALIFDQYMEHLENMRQMDMEIAGEFIVMASELMLIKSRILLPKPADDAEETDPRFELAALLEEYKKIKEAAAFLSELYAHHGGRLTKEPEEIDASAQLAPHDAALFQDAFQRILARNRDFIESYTAPEGTIGELLAYRITPVPVKIFGIIKYMRKNGDTSLNSLLSVSRTKSELIASFVAVLELLRAQRLIIINTDSIGDNSNNSKNNGENAGTTDDEMTHDFMLRLNREKRRL